MYLPDTKKIVKQLYLHEAKVPGVCGWRTRHEDRSLSGRLPWLSAAVLTWRERWSDRAEPGWMGCKQGVRGALLEAAGLSLPAVPCRTELPRPPYYSLLQKNSSRLNEKSFPGGEAGDQLVTSSSSTIMAAVRRRNKLLNGGQVSSTDARAASLEMMKNLGRTWGSSGQNCCTAAAMAALRSFNSRCKGPFVIWSVVCGGMKQCWIKLPGRPWAKIPLIVNSNVFEYESND